MLLPNYLQKYDSILLSAVSLHIHKPLCYNLVLIYIKFDFKKWNHTFPGYLPGGTRVPGSLPLTSASGACALTSQINLTKACSVPITPPQDI